jgi:hypothetical protein
LASDNKKFTYEGIERLVIVAYPIGKAVFASSHRFANLTAKNGFAIFGFGLAHAPKRA